MSSSDDDEDVQAISKKLNKSDKEVNYSDNEELKEKKSIQNSNKNPKIEKVIKDSTTKEKKPTKKEDMSSSDDDEDVQAISKKLNKNDSEMNYSQNSNKNQKIEKVNKESTTKEKKPIKKEESSSEDEDSSEKSQKKEKKMKESKEEEKEEEKEKSQNKENKKEIVKEDKKEIKKKKKESSSSSSDSDSSSESSKEKKKNKVVEKKEENKSDKEKEEKEKREREEKEKKEREKKLKEEKEKEKEKENYSNFRKGIEDNRKREEEAKQFSSQNNNRSNIPSLRNNNNDFRQNYNNNRNNNDNNYQNSYVRKNAKKYDLNTEKSLKEIISGNTIIIDEMRNAYPGIPKLDCANILKKIQNNTSSQTLFEIMNKIHRDISTGLTINKINLNQVEKKNLFPIDPYEIIDTVYNNPEHVKVMKYYKIYSLEDKNKLSPYLQASLPNDFYYRKDREREEKRRKLIKYSDGSFNYIPVTCNNIKYCQDKNCPYSHNDNENNFHPLFYKTTLSSNNSDINKNKNLIKNACDLFADFRIIYNYKNESIIKLMKLIDEKKLSKFSFKEYMKNKIHSFSLNTFKTLECQAIKSGMKCSKSDPHLCYYYHDISEKRRPPTLFRYINEMCPNQSIIKGKIKKKCENGDFCNKCHSRYEYYYHSLFYGKAMTCTRKKEFGKCQFEETCYAYHPYKEPGYIRTKEEIIQERKDELLQKYTEENSTLGNLIEKFRCIGCDTFRKKLKYYFLTNCEHVICDKCFKKMKKCPKCETKYKKEEEGEDYVELDITDSSKNIDELMKAKYAKKKEEEKKTKNDDDEKEESKEIKKNESDEEEENENNDNGKDANDSM